ncbi:hypothetical protein ACPVPU_08295 [Sphingomonas sp. CJ99]
MSQDARDSIYLWLGGIAFVAFFWISLQLHLFDRIPEWVIQFGQGLLILLLLVRFGRWCLGQIEKRSESNG